MTTRIPLPGGQWADVKDPGDLTGADIDDWQAFLYDLQTERQGPDPEPVPDPDNPAVMKVPDRPAVKMTAADLFALRDKRIGLVVTAWSYDLPLPYTAESRRHLPGQACNLLNKASLPAAEVLDDTEPDPKPGDGTGTNGSADTSPDSTPSPLPVSPPAPSSTASG